MSTEVIETVLVYAAIPAFLVVLCALLYLIIRYHLRLSFVQEGKQALKYVVEKQKRARAFSPVIYLLTWLFVACIMVAAYFTEKSKTR